MNGIRFFASMVALFGAGCAFAPWAWDLEGESGARMGFGILSLAWFLVAIVVVYATRSTRSPSFARHTLIGVSGLVLLTLAVFAILYKPIYRAVAIHDHPYLSLGGTERPDLSVGWYGSFTCALLLATCGARAAPWRSSS